MGKGKYKGRRAAAFVFDLDGTLVDSGEDIARSANFVRGHFGLPTLPVPTVVGYVGDGVEMLLRRALTLAGATGASLPAEQLQEAMAVFAAHYGRHLLDNTRLYPGVLDVLLRFRSFPLLLATNKPRSFADRILEGLGIKGAFGRIVAGDETSARKPDPEHIRLAVEGLDVDPGEIVVVGDSPHDVGAGRAFGAVTVGCTYGLVPAGKLKAARPDHVIAAILELVDLFPSR